MRSRRHVAVIGAGVVGAASAIELLRAGHAVTLIDPAEPGGSQASSYGNAGWLSSHSILPPSEPEMWRRVPTYLRDPLGPLAIRWRHVPQALPWLLRFLRAGRTRARVRRIAQALRPLLADAPVLHRRLASEAGVEHLIAQDGLLHVYLSREHFATEHWAWEIRRDAGVEFIELDAASLLGREPALHPRYRYGVLVPEAGHCRDPGAYVGALAAHAIRQGAQRRQDAATGFRVEAGRLRAVKLSSGDEIACDAAVVAAGVWSKALARSAGDRVPLQAERGYHSVIADAGSEARLPLMAADLKVIVTRMNDGMRVAGQVEIAATDDVPNWRRAHILRDHLLSTYPHLSVGLREDRVSYWMGCRPSSPDGLPYIDLARDTSDVVYAFGHGHVGMVGSARTGRIVAQLVGKAPPEIPIGPFSARRFSSLV